MADDYFERDALRQRKGQIQRAVDVYMSLWENKYLHGVDLESIRDAEKNARIQIAASCLGGSFSDLVSREVSSDPDSGFVPCSLEAPSRLLTPRPEPLKKTSAP